MHAHRPVSLVTLLAAAFAVAMLAGCGDDGASASSGGPDTTGSDFFQTYAKALCGRTFACCDAAVRAAHDLNVSSADACASQLEMILNSVSGGKVNGTFAPADGQACLAEVDVAPCDQIQILGVLIGVDEEVTPSCKEAWVGSVPEGGTCSTNWDCAEDRCLITVEQGGESTSACKALSALGGPCEWSFDCEDGLRCDQPSPPNAGTCATRVALGGSCKGSSDCEEELRCGQDGACQPREKEGGPCMTDSDCVAGMACDSTCAPLGAAGAPCDSDSDCASFACADATGTCADVCKGS
jgi:hypothetical protein